MFVMMDQNSRSVEADQKAVGGAESLHLEVPAVPEQVGKTRRAVADFLRLQSWNEEDAGDLLLAMGEACTNAVSYGGGGVADPRLIVSCRPLDPRRLQIDVRNQGNGFHPDLARCAQMPAAEAFATHGRGFGLMLALVDDVQVLSDGENTIVRLTKSKTG